MQFQLHMYILHWLVSCGWMWQRECPHTHTPTHPWFCMIQYGVREEHSQPDLPTVMMQWWTPTSSELSVFCRCRGVRITCPSPLTQLQEWCCLQTDIHSSFPMWGLMMPVTISVHPPIELVATNATFFWGCWVSSYKEIEHKWVIGCSHSWRCKILGDVTG